MIVVGGFFVLVYHLGTKEPPRVGGVITRSTIGSKGPSDRLAMYKWFINPHFYLVSIEGVILVIINGCGLIAGGCGLHVKSSHS